VIPGTPVDSNKATAAKYLQRARAAFAQNNLTGAVGWYHRANNLNATFGPDEDSPEKLAADLRQRGITLSQLPQPGRMVETPRVERDAPHASLSDHAAAARPVGNVAPAPSGPTVIHNPYVTSVSDIPRPPQPPAASRAGDLREQARELLLRARLELAGDNARMAAQLAKQAAAVGASFADGEDSPQHVMSLIDRFHNVARTPASGDASQFRRRYADLLMDQAQVLARSYGKFDTAEEMAQRAANLGAGFRAGERDPQTVIKEIARLRSGGATPAAPPAANDFSSAAVANISDSSTASNSDMARRRAQALMAQAHAAVDRGDIESAHELALAAHELNVPESAFRGQSPAMTLMHIRRLRQQRPPTVVPASAVMPADRSTGTDGRTHRYPVSHGVYDPSADRTRNIPAQDLQARGRPASTGPSGPESGDELFREGEKALSAHDLQRARELFQRAWKYEAQLDGDTRQKLQDHLQMLALSRQAPRRLEQVSPLEEIDSQQQILLRQMSAEITSEQAAADRMKGQDPFGALEQLKNLRGRVESSELDPTARNQLLTRVDRAIGSMQKYIDQNRPQIELDARNAAVLESVDRSRQMKYQVEEKLAEITEEFNTLMDQNRFDEAEVLAKKAREIAPESELVKILTWKSRFAKRIQRNAELQSEKENAFVETMFAVDRSAVPFPDSEVIRYPRNWEALTGLRDRLFKEHSRRLTQAELEIKEALKQKIEVRFRNQPLAEVMDALGRAVGINVLLDEDGMAAEGVTSSTPVTINLAQPISLRSALNHILLPKSLSYVIQDEVLKITSEHNRISDTYVHVYDVADLVIPIPNFVPSYNMGLAGAIREAYDGLGYGSAGMGMNASPLPLLANNAQTPPQTPTMLAQLGAAGMLGSTSNTRKPQPVGFGPGGLGGASQADFDTLIELITSTIAPTTWVDAGGAGSIEGFDTNLSLVISQTQEVHDEIVDLLEQLRRLQDLQVTIEVRFITLQDNFFERIGIDFDFDIDDNVGGIVAGGFPDDTGPAITFGLDPTGAPTVDLDLPFDQGSFGTTVPQFGGFDAATAANFGYAILSDIEAFILIQAAQGDTRTNVMQAPKVTLFNGQQAFVSDTVQRPFVTSVIPVVGDFAAAHQPVIVVLTEGTSLSVQAVVSPDRRFVRLTLVPFFSRIGNVDEFTFDGAVTSNSGTAVVDPEDPEQIVRENEEFARTGTTVQLPTFAFVTVTTTVSVPDGGTVLLGGIKRLSEGRDERGVPLVSKIPYISRLFRNVGIGRDAESLMLMVTPRIIIQEEEEEKLGIPPPP
jgi:general secretion pathway protein D